MRGHEATFTARDGSLTLRLVSHVPLRKRGRDVVARVTKRERIDTPAGRFDTIVVEPDMNAGGLYRDEESKLTIWYSDDERHIPVRIRSDVKIGAITMTLRGMSAGVTSITP